jgi:DNA-damage-inducible protein J
MRQRRAGFSQTSGRWGNRAPCVIDIVNKNEYFYIQGEAMAQTNINIRMDEQLKKQFEMFCANVGLTMSTAFNVFAKTSVRLQKIPFEITAAADPFYSESNMNVLMESIKQLEAGKGVEHELLEA